MRGAVIYEDIAAYAHIGAVRNALDVIDAARVDGRDRCLADVKRTTAESANEQCRRYKWCLARHETANLDET